MTLRNLLFHCYPVRETLWPWHVERLLAYRPIWNGRRIVVLALDEKTAPEDELRAAFAPMDAEILVRRNIPALAETAHFVEALGRLASLRSDETTFYAHAKGVTKTEKFREPVRRWTDLLYRATLSFPDLIDRRLELYGTVGCLRWTHLKVKPLRTGWCWAGTFFWVRHDLLFARDWRRIAQEVYGVEDYPSWQFSRDESSCLTREEITPEELYGGIVDKRFIDETMIPLELENRNLRAGVR
jgi:hypothetical protein